jgi:hypothetical protein
MLKRSGAVLLVLCFVSGFAAIAQEWDVWPQGKGFDHPKIANALEELISNSQTSPLFITDVLRQMPYNVHRRGDRVRVVIETESERAISKIASAIERGGGQVELNYGTQIQALLPLRNVRQIADLKEVQFVRLPVRPILTQGTFISEGAEAHRCAGLAQGRGRWAWCESRGD